MSFLGVTIHFINNSWEIKSRVLACDHFEERHTALNIATAYEDLVDRYGIRGKVKKVVADNASSMIKAFDVCLPGLYDNKERDSDEADVIEEELDMELGVLQYLPERMSCFAHTQQLCVKDGLTHPKVKNSFPATAIQKVSAIVSSVRKSITAAQFLQEKGIYLQASNVT